MELYFAPVTEGDAQAILAWRYDPPYAAYNASAGESSGADYTAELLDRRSPYFAMRLVSGADWEREPPAGFFAFGSACEVGAEPDAPAEPHLYRADGSITIGLGLRPNLTGSGLGLPFVEAGLALARERFHPTLFRLFVYAWNQRAIMVYERAGFTVVSQACVAGQDGQSIFIEMVRQV
jgi:ribosomal-protein-alanine N-acetyltransferase